MNENVVEDFNESIEHNFGRHCCVIDTEVFLQSFLHVDEPIVETIFETVTRQGHYTDRRWKAFPAVIDDEESETQFCNSFVDTVNAIHKAAEEAAKDNPCPDGLGATSWVYNDSTRSGKDRNVVPVRPNFFLALTAVQNHVQKMEMDHAKDGQGGSLKFAAWWLQLVAVVEMQGRRSKGHDVVKRLVSHLRRILREQLDRRFVFGFTLGISRVSVWMHDRSGALVTRTSIDIHEEPRRFIRLIAAFAVLPADKLGLDLTMKLYVSPGIVLPSFRLDDKSVSAYHANPYDTRWVIELNHGMTYLTVKYLSVARSRVIPGRGTNAWAVVPYIQEEEHPKVFVLKQSWRPLNVRSEGELYEQATSASGSKSEFLGEIWACEEVELRGEKDDTEAIRHGLGSEPDSSPVVENYWSTLAKKTQLQIELTDQGDIQSFLALHQEEPVSQVRTRVLLSTYGWPVTFFSTLNELLRVIRDAVQGHQYLYDNGILHRDISLGNMIIEWRPDEPMSHHNPRGRLIDLDRAKKGIHEEQVLPPPKEGRQFNGFTPEELAQMFTTRKFKQDNLKVEPNVFTAARKVFDHVEAQAYASEVLEHYVKFGHLHGTVSDKILGWELVRKSWHYKFPIPVSNGSLLNVFGVYVQGSGAVGTRLYISSEILSGGTYHDAIHDMESFFWVLIHICLTCCGPGVDRRRETTNNVYREDVPSLGLQEALWHYFDGDIKELTANKRMFFYRPEDFESRLLANFHPYFDPLKPLLSEWYSLLRLGYTYRAFEYHSIHDRVIEMLGRALDSIGSNANAEDEAAKKVLKSREDDVKRILERAQVKPLIGNFHATPKRVNPETCQDNLNPVDAPETSTPQQPKSKRRKI